MLEHILWMLFAFWMWYNVGIKIYSVDNYSKEIESLLLNEGMYSDEVCVDEENVIYMPIYN